MLDSLRLFAKSWPGKILGGFLLVGVAGFGINNVITDLGSNTVARVGDEEISTQAFMRAYQGQLNEVAQQIGSMPTPEEASSFGIPGMVLQRLAQDAALTRMANGFGLGVSDTRLSAMLRDDPSFAGTLGTFDPAAFRQVLQFSGLTESEYFETQSNVAKRQQLAQALFADTTLPAAASTLIKRYVDDQRTIDYIIVGDTNVATPPAPTDADLTTFLTANQTDYRTVEIRTVDLLALSPQILAESKTVSDDAIAAEYERTKASLVTVERRTIQQVALPTPELVTTFEQGLAAGTTFDALISQSGLTPTQLGTLSEAQVTDATLATAAFGLPDGGFSIIDGVTGKRAVHISAIEAGGQTSLEDARDTIAQSLALTEAREEYSDILDQIEELRAADQPLGEIATRFGLTLYQVPLTQTGAELSIVPSVPEVDRATVTQAVFAAQMDRLTPAVSLNGNNNLWFDLSAIDVARDQTLDEVREAVTTAWTANQINDAIIAETQAITTRLDAGEAFQDVALSLSLTPQLSQPLTRSGAPDTYLDVTVAAAVFAGGPEHYGTTMNGLGEHIVFQVVSLTPAEGTLDEQANAALANEVRNGIYGDFVTAVRDEAGLDINEPALQQALTLNTGL